MDAGIFFYRPSFSRAACAPTKLAEFLGCGKPCLSNAGVGDMAEILQENGAGVAIVRFDAQSLNDGLLQLLALVEDPGTKQRCVETARKHFSLDEGVQRYAILYRSMLDRSGSM
jgi:glycosyltransferase involved in cell wall biosynthesis